MTTPRHWVGVGAIIVGAGVALGAFGAHGLRTRVSPDLLGTFETGVRYHVYHGMAIMVAALAGERWPIAWRTAAWCFAGGVLLFAGSLYALVLTGTSAFGFVTPFGGAAFLFGWGVFGWSALRVSSSS